MDYVWFLEQIFITIIIPLLGILTVFIIKCVDKYTEKIQTQVSGNLTTKYLGMLHDLIVACVIATNQTYVNSLKEQGKFDIEAQKRAFQMTYDAVKAILSDEMVYVLSEAYEDLDQYIRNQIEYTVFTNKQIFFSQDDEDGWNPQMMDEMYQ